MGWCGGQLLVMLCLIIASPSRVSGQLDPDDLPDPNTSDFDYRSGQFGDALSREVFDNDGTPATLDLDYAMKNISKFKTDSVRIRCEISGNPLPRYKWFKDTVPIGENERRITIRLTPWGSRLKIESLEPYDSGWYTCKAVNKAGQVNTTGFLEVKDGYPPQTGKNKDSGGRGGGKSNPPDISDNTDSFYGKYDPDIYNKYKEEERKSQEEGDGFCQVFRGTTCSRFLQNRTIYVTSEYSQGIKEENFLAAFTTIQASNTMSKECQDYAIPFLCYHTFPLCDNHPTNPKPRQVCRDECEMLKSNICQKEYVIGKHHPRIGDKFLPKCYELAPPGTQEGDGCVRIGVTKTPPKMNCYNGSGENYRGQVNRTRSGRTCQNWLHNPSFKSKDNKELGNHNFCRNPNGTFTGPWCFTDPYYHHSELCDIPKCTSYQTGEPVDKLMFILVPGIIVPLALVLLLAIVCLFQRHRKQKGAGLKNGRQAPQNNSESHPLTAKSGTRIREFPLSSIRFMQELGEGAFGKVYKGDLLGLYAENTVSKVAVKTLKENATPKMKNDFRREVDLMTEMRHPNIVCLLGVCMKQEPMCMLFEFMPHGDLHEFLICRSPNSDVSVADDDCAHKPMLEYPDMLHIATQVAAGMEYLASHHFVHRDLAARNVLVGDNLSVKISDFGLSRDIYSSDYYRVQSKSLLPVRWMPPESILYGKFTTESDVWSFGIVMWEIFSYGLQPYYGFSNQEVIEVVRKRQILPCPEDCPTRIYGLMVECWHETPARRPLFREIHARLKAWKTEIMMQNPHWSLSQSHSAHSSSHQSSQSGPSHQGSTGPSNTTAITGLTGSSGGSDPSQSSHCMSPAPPLGMMPPSYHALPPHYLANQVQMPQHPLMMGPQHGQVMNQKLLAQFNSPPNQLPNGISKLSPPGSVASSKASNSSGSQGSGQPYKPNTMPHPQTAIPQGGSQNNGPAVLPLTDSSNKYGPQNTYIPDTRTEYNEI
ncbi:inactive tyrosine-protein kinase transmembrane receptor ROR1-like isoform X2 [Mizuhopecten yessoensis]|uniref:inactive tyrosine-protein kinase transmembrane receptor ROR1-like isoform X2 n=1 Tax=Mizuhopecten yessoensis TaxID=6573 RepID=UPI000B458879|nr:inactive tyrosine-protein kinase transmembrane receptor ROR1-like isoform X2 [Mizuhopecten yessoensis]